MLIDTSDSQPTKSVEGASSAAGSSSLMEPLARPNRVQDAASELSAPPVPPGLVQARLDFDQASTSGKRPTFTVPTESDPDSVAGTSSERSKAGSEAAAAVPAEEQETMYKTQTAKRIASRDYKRRNRKLHKALKDIRSDDAAAIERAKVDIEELERERATKAAIRAGGKDTKGRGDLETLAERLRTTAEARARNDEKRHEWSRGDRPTRRKVRMPRYRQAKALIKPPSEAEIEAAREALSRETSSVTFPRVNKQPIVPQARDSSSTSSTVPM